MMKKKIDIQRLITAFLLVLTLPLWVSCEKEDDEIAMSPPPYYDNSLPNSDNTLNGDVLLNGAPASFATVLESKDFINTNGITTLASMEDDKMGFVYIDNSDRLEAFKANYPGQRILYSYRQIGTHKESGIPIIRIGFIRKIPSYAIDFYKTGEEEDYGHDGIHVIGNLLSKQYLTFHFQVYSLGGEPIFSLLAKEGSKPDAEGYLTLEIRHKMGNGLGYISNPTPTFHYASFLMTDAPGFADGTLKGFRIHYIDLNNQTQTLNIEIQ